VFEEKNKMFKTVNSRGTEQNYEVEEEWHRNMLTPEFKRLDWCERGSTVTYKRK
jgi:hypothetical protein